MSLELYRAIRPQFSNSHEEYVGNILEEPISSWSYISQILKTLPDSVQENNELTFLGSGPEFMKPFVDMTSAYTSLYENSKWGTILNGKCVEYPKKVFDDSKRDPSFAQKVEISDKDTVIFIGDIHSSIQSFIDVMDSLLTRNIIDDKMVLKEGYHVIFLGDIFDRGPWGLDILNIIMQFKMKNMERCIINSGNHEDKGMYSHGHNGTGVEMVKQLDNAYDVEFVDNLMLFLPSVVFLKMGNKWYQCCHGGIEESYNPKAFLESQFEFDFHGYDEGRKLFHMGLRWTDFNLKVEGVANSSRGGGVKKYGMEETNMYLEGNGLSGIIRGHQDMTHFLLLPRTRKAIRGFDVDHDDGMVFPDDYPIGSLDSDWERIIIPHIFETFLVVTTSTANRARDLGYSSYLEFKSEARVNLECRDRIMEKPSLLAFAGALNHPIVEHVVTDYDPMGDLNKPYNFYSGIDEVITSMKRERISMLADFIHILESFKIQKKKYTLFRKFKSVFSK